MKTSYVQLVITMDTFAVPLFLDRFSRPTILHSHIWQVPMALFNREERRTKT
jgi:hypothetical protein